MKLYLEALSKVTPGQILNKDVVVGSTEHDGVARVELMVGAVDLGLVCCPVQDNFHVLSESLYKQYITLYTNTLKFS